MRTMNGQNNDFFSGAAAPAWDRTWTTVPANARLVRTDSGRRGRARWIIGWSLLQLEVEEEDMHTRTTQTVAPKPTSVLHRGGSRSPNAVTTAPKQRHVRARCAFPCLYGHCSVTPTNQLRRGQRTLPAMPSEESAEVPRRKKKKLRKQSLVEDTYDGDVEMQGVSSSRLSDPGERLSPDSAVQKRKRRRKKAATIELEDDQADLVSTEAVEQNTEGEEVVRKVTKRKKKPRPVEVPLPDELSVEDDITTDGPPAPPHTLFAPPQAQSQPVSKVFVERSRRFQASERAAWSRNSGQLEHMDMPPLSTWGTRDVSLKLHQSFRMLGLFAQGFLAGFAVWHIVVVYVLAGPHLTTLSNLLQQYHGLAYPCQSLLYLLLVLSTVCAFDRVNLAKGSMALRQLMSLEPVALVSFLYFCALILSLSQQMTSDRINLYPSFNSSLWPTGSERQNLHPWVTVNLVVALLVGVSWVFVSTRPDTDYTEDYLLSMMLEATKEDKSELTA